MQTKKDEVRKKIYDAALEEFLEKSYMKATIRSISKKSGVPIGNIYRYYENKDAIFEDVVSEFYVEITKIFKEEPAAYKMSKDDVLKKFDEGSFLLDFVDRIMGLNIDGENSSIAYIIFHNSEGSQYENLKEQLEAYFVGNFLEALKKIIGNKKLLKEKERLISGTGIAFLKSIECIFENCLDDYETGRKLLVEFSIVYSKNLPERLGLK